MEVLTTKQAANILGITQRRINALIQSGKLPAQVFGGVYMIQESDLALVSDRKAGRPKKEPDIEIAPGAKQWKAEQLPLPAVAPTTKRAAKRAVAPKTKTVATKKGGKK